MADEPIYPVIELQAENLKLKDELIETLKSRVIDLERENSYLRELVRYNKDEQDVGSHMIGPPTPPNNKPRIRTMSEVARILEAKSINAVTGKLSAEDINEDKTT